MEQLLNPHSLKKEVGILTVSVIRAKAAPPVRLTASAAQAVEPAVPASRENVTVSATPIKREPTARTVAQATVAVTEFARAERTICIALWTAR
jgi:hypothetical protein